MDFFWKRQARRSEASGRDAEAMM